MQRVLIFCTSTRNPFVDAWIATVRATGARVAILVDDRGTRETEIPPGIAADTVFVTASPGWADDVTELLGGPPTVLFYWWGLGSLTNTLPVQQWPSVPVVLCVDTLPNASRLRAEVREVVQANVLLRQVRGLVLTSDRMRDALNRMTVGRFRGLPSSVVTSPFPLASHYDGELPRRAGERVRLCFTGRSDYLFSDDPSMSKDAVGPWLQRFIAADADVDVMPLAGDAGRHLKERGFGFYEDVPREGMTDGRFARMLTRYDGHLVVYAQSTPTVKRRIATSLSTRFATAVCAPTPIVTPAGAAFAADFFAEHPIGFCSDAPRQIIERVQADGDAMAKVWFAEHEQWAGEAAAEQLARLWMMVAT